MNWQEIIQKAKNFGESTINNVSGAVQKLFKNDKPKTEKVYVVEKGKQGGWVERPVSTSQPEKYPMPPTQKPSSMPSSQPKQEIPEEIQRLITPSPSPKPTSGLARNPDVNSYKITDNVHSAIQSASKEFGVPKELLYDIVFQESKFDPTRRAQDYGFDGKTIDPKTGKLLPFSSAEGLFQFTDDTWDTVKNYAKNPANSLKNFPQDADKHDPLQNARAAAYLIKMGQLSKWDASEHVWGNYWTPQELEDMGYYEQSPDHILGTRPSQKKEALASAT